MLQQCLQPHEQAVVAAGMINADLHAELTAATEALIVAENARTTVKDRLRLIESTALPGLESRLSVMQTQRNVAANYDLEQLDNEIAELNRDISAQRAAVKECKCQLGDAESQLKT